MKILPWETIQSEHICDCRIFAVDKVRRRHPETEKTGDFFRLQSDDWVNVVAVTEHDELILIRQYRHGTDEITVEIPGGIVDEGETPEQAAARELFEETGFISKQVQVIGRVRPNPAILTNWTYTVLATDLHFTGERAQDEHEDIEVEFYPAARIEELLRSATINHALVMNALYWYRLYTEGMPHTI